MSRLALASRAHRGCENCSPVKVKGRCSYHKLEADVGSDAVSALSGNWEGLGLMESTQPLDRSSLTSVPTTRQFGRLARHVSGEQDASLKLRRDLGTYVSRAPLGQTTPNRDSAHVLDVPRLSAVIALSSDTDHRHAGPPPLHFPSSAADIALIPCDRDSDLLTGCVGCSNLGRLLRNRRVSLAFPICEAR